MLGSGAALLLQIQVSPARRSPVTIRWLALAAEAEVCCGCERMWRLLMPRIDDRGALVLALALAPFVAPA